MGSIPERKVCGKCKQELSSSAFGRRIDVRDGLKSWCRTCIRTYGGQGKRPMRSAWKHEGVGYIPLTQGRVAIVDVDMLPILEGVWCFDKVGYAVKRNRGAGGRISMHRLIAGVADNPQVMVDHINGNPLDNRRNNLRIATKGENTVNVHKNRIDNKTGYRGITCNNPERGYWFARFRWKGIIYYDCGHRTPESAARAYDALVRAYGPSIAYLNFPEELNTLKELT